MDEPFSFGYWVRRRRKALDLTQVELARRVSCAESMLRKIEADERRPSQQIAMRLAAVLEVPEAERAAFLKVARGELASHRLAAPATDVPLPTTGAGPRSDVPALPTRLIGRSRERAALHALLDRHDVRLVTLTGAGGSGKTRLAVQVAVELVEAGAARFPDGVCFVDLAPLADAALVAPAIVHALALPEAPGVPADEQLRTALRNRRALLVLDNFEQVLDATLMLSELLRVAPGLIVLATSRVALRLRGEREYPVGPLVLPEEEPPQAIDGSDTTAITPGWSAIAASPAVQLFVERAQAVQPDFALDASNAHAVAAICQRLDGLPLAIELVAPRVRLFTPQTLLARLQAQGTLPLLTNGARDLPQRQQTIRTTIDWSYQLLNEDEQALFTRLGLFVGGCTIAAVTAVMTAALPLLNTVAGVAAPNAGSGDRAVLEGLTTLVGQNLLKRVNDAGNEPRFVMLETIREYALERLVARGEAASAWSQFASYYVSLAEAAGPKLRGGRSQLWLDRAWIEQALALGRQLEFAVPLSAKALCIAGVIAALWNDYGRAIPLLEESIRLARQIGDRTSAAEALLFRGLIARNRGAYAHAEVLQAECLALRQAQGDRWGTAQALLFLGDVALDQGNLPQAAMRCEAALALSRDEGYTLWHGWAQTNLGCVAYLQREYGRATMLLMEGQRLFEELEAPAAVAEVLLHLGRVAQAQGDGDGAARQFAESLALLSEFYSGNKRDIAYNLTGLAGVAMVNGKPERAAKLLGVAAALREVAGILLPPVYRNAYDRAVADVRTHLDEITFATAWTAGRLLTVEQAITEALMAAHM